VKFNAGILETMRKNVLLLLLLLLGLKRSLINLASNVLCYGKIKLFVYLMVQVVKETTEFHSNSFRKATQNTFVIGKFHFLLLHI
jgi:hypothetical protein